MMMINLASRKLVGGDLWIEVVRLCTAKIDALTLSLHIMSGSKTIAASPYGTGQDRSKVELVVCGAHLKV